MADKDIDHAENRGGSFFSRWSKRKAGARAGAGDAAFSESAAAEPSIDEGFEAKLPEDGRPSTAFPAAPEANQPEPPPVLPSLETLTAESDFSPFMQANVPPALRNQAMKKLFADPHYNVMDMLDTYVDDYSTSEPIPLDWLKKMSQSRALKLFDDEEEAVLPTTGSSDGSAAPLHAAPGNTPPSNDLPQLEAGVTPADNAVPAENTPSGDT
jgi:Protein of unknown function (DUF3306)